MREILFRGKRRDNGIWIYGDLSIIAHKCYIDDRLKNMERVDPETVGQFTGEIDEHGVKIFEHDLCYYFDSNCDEDDGALEVVYKEGAFWLKGDGWTFPLCDIDTTTSVEVIGNIYDNPELLGGAK